MMEPLKKKRVYEDIVQQFAHKIEIGELKAGDKLPTERELVEIMGVSRTSIREALRAMELVGMVESKVGDGTYIKSLKLDRALVNVARAFNADDDFVTDMFEVRVLIETYAAKNAAKLRTEEHLRQMEKVIEIMKRDIHAGNRGLEADNRFHQIIAEAAGNKALICILSLCSELFNNSIEAANAHVNVLDIIAEHEEMYEAIKNKNSSLAGKLMKAHVNRARSRTLFLKAEKR